MGGQVRLSEATIRNLGLPISAGSLLASALFAMAGCQKSAPPAPKDPAAFLKWSMDRYAEMPSLQASIFVKAESGGQALTSLTRTFRYERPNKFRVDSVSQDGAHIITVSDGEREADYDNLRRSNSDLETPAPANLSTANTADMLDPNLCGSVIYPFFGGSANFPKLVKGPVTQVGVTQSPDGETVRVIKFDTPDLIGNVVAAIGVTTGRVYVVKYDFSGAKQKIVANLPALKAEAHKENPKVDDKEVDRQVQKLLQTQYTEEFENLKVGQPLSAGSFDRNIPGAQALADAPISGGGDESPLPLGKPAPEATVQTLDGKSVRLADLKGHPIVLDFWATWCAPCRACLPETARIAKQGTKVGLQVLAITDEDPETIKSFLGKQSYQLPAFRDLGDRAETAFQVGGLPSEVFIDSKGNVAAYLVGAHAPADVLAALSKAGVKLED